MTQDSQQGKVAIITGAGSGIGQNVALTLLANGFRVVLAGRRADSLQETISRSAAPGSALAVATDVTDPASVDALFDRTAAHFGRVDVLFNNAGINAPAIPLEDLTDAQWQGVVNTNLSGMFYCIRAAFRTMKAQNPRGGRIINNGSISAHAPRPNSIAYTATKHAVTGLTKSASLDGRKYDIACGQIDIGNALTDMARRMTQGVPQADGRIEIEAVMDVQQVGDAVLHMARLPIDVNIPFLTVMANKMPFLGRG